MTRAYKTCSRYLPAQARRWARPPGCRSDRQRWWGRWGCPPRWWPPRTTPRACRWRLRPPEKTGCTCSKLKNKKHNNKMPSVTKIALSWHEEDLRTTTKKEENKKKKNCEETDLHATEVKNKINGSRLTGSNYYRYSPQQLNSYSRFN